MLMTYDRNSRINPESVARFAAQFSNMYIWKIMLCYNINDNGNETAL